MAAPLFCTISHSFSTSKQSVKSFVNSPAKTTANAFSPYQPKGLQHDTRRLFIKVILHLDRTHH
jgi:hypothetical protein